MTRSLSRSLPALAVLVLAAAAAPAHAQVRPIPGGMDVRQEQREYNALALHGIGGMLVDWRAAWERRDARAVMGHYTDDALLLVRSGKPLQGRRAIEAGVEAILATTGPIQVGVDDFTASGNIAYAFGSFWYPNEGGGATEGRYVMVFRLDGRRWKIRSQVFSAALPPTGAVGAETSAAETP